jgi:murein DD-endopeptidase MepM/ murein hydrolase activator NlpD
MPNRIFQHRGGYVARQQRVKLRAILTSFFLILLRSQIATSEPLLQPPVTPACVSSPFGWRHAVGPHAPAGFHNGIDLASPLDASCYAVAGEKTEGVTQKGS